MANQNDTYRPSAELVDLLKKYFGGDRSKEVVDAINAAAVADSNFLNYFRKLQTQFNKQGSKSGNSWSVGTHGSRVSGTNGNGEVGGISKNVSQWNQRRNERAGFNGSATSPGGFKSSGRDEDSVLRRSGEMSADAIKSKVTLNGDGSVTLGDRSYTKAEANAVIKRGMSGATMNWQDQAVYDAFIKYGTNMDEVVRNKSEEMRNSAVDKEELAAKEASRQAQMRADADAADVLKRQRDLEDWQYKQDYTAKLAEQANAKKAETEAKDADLNWKLKNGFSYTDDQRKQYDELTRIRSDAINGVDAEGGFLLGEDRDEYIRQIDDKISAIKYNPVAKIENEPTLEEIYENKTYVNDRGVRMAQDNNGKWYVVDNPKDYEAENRAYERENVLKYKEQERQDKWLDARTNELMKSTKDKYGREVPGLPYDQALEQAQENMRLRFGIEDEQQPSAEEIPNQQVQVQQSHVNQPTPSGMGTAVSNFFGPKKEIAQNEAGDEIVAKVCPVCGEYLNEFGVCDVCGYPDEALVSEWKMYNGQMEG